MSIFQIFQVTDPLLGDILHFLVILDVNLLKQILLNELFLGLHPTLLPLNQVGGLLWPVMRLVVLPLDGLLVLFSLFLGLNLHLYKLKVL